MAARIEPAPSTGDVVDLRQIAAADLDPLLNEEVDAWQRILHWDFRKSADLVRRFVDLRALNGYALVDRHKVTGYAYFVYEDHKALIGDLYVRRAAYTAEAEQLLLAAVLEAAFDSSRLRRIEAQLMMMRSPPSRALPGARHMREFQRNFMMLESMRSAQLPPGKAAATAHIERWTEPFQEQAAHLIATTYATHIDSQINDQYRSVSGARRFLYNIVQYPGCGVFAKAASLAAFEPQSGRMLGICLSSLIGPHTGHITQICVAPAAQGTGIGYELLRRSLEALRDSGCKSASLTVTGGNTEAIRLYERIGFRTTQRFLALAWEDFQPGR
jgi:ribosomal protein S18 acetylase RimI-like enzyme